MIQSYEDTGPHALGFCGAVDTSIQKVAAAPPDHLNTGPHPKHAILKPKGSESCLFSNEFSTKIHLAEKPNLAQRKAT